MTPSPTLKYSKRDSPFINRQSLNSTFQVVEVTTPKPTPISRFDSCVGQKFELSTNACSECWCLYARVSLCGSNYLVDEPIIFKEKKHTCISMDLQSHEEIDKKKTNYTHLYTFHLDLLCSQLNLIVSVSVISRRNVQKA